MCRLNNIICSLLLCMTSIHGQTSCQVNQTSLMPLFHSEYDYMCISIWFLVIFRIRHLGGTWKTCFFISPYTWSHQCPGFWSPACRCVFISHHLSRYEPVQEPEPVSWFLPSTPSSSNRDKVLSSFLKSGSTVWAKENLDTICILTHSLFHASDSFVLKWPLHQSVSQEHISCNSPPSHVLCFCRQDFMRHRLPVRWTSLGPPNTLSFSLRMCRSVVVDISFFSTETLPCGCQNRPVPFPAPGWHQALSRGCPLLPGRPCMLRSNEHGCVQTAFLSLRIQRLVGLR